jgi:hypothetical protein
MTVEDLLVTRMEVVGAGGYARDIYMGARALGVLKNDLKEAQRAQLAWTVVSAAGSLAIVEAFKKATEAAGEHDEAVLRASESFKQLGHATPDRRIEEFADRIQDTTIVFRDQAIEIEGLYANYGLGTDQAEKFTKATLEASVALKAQGTSAEQIARFVGTAIEMTKEGNTRGLVTLARRIGLVVNEARAATDPMGAILEELNRRGGEQAELMREKLPGATEAFSNSLRRLGQNVGVYFVGPISEAIKLGTGFLDVLNKYPAAVAGLGAVGAGLLGIRAVSGIMSLLPMLGIARAGIGGLLARGAGAAGVAGAGSQLANWAKIGGAAGTGALTWSAIRGGGLPKGFWGKPSFFDEMPVTDKILLGAGIGRAPFRPASQAVMAERQLLTGGAVAAGAGRFGLLGRFLGSPLGLGLGLTAAGYGLSALAAGHEKTGVGRFESILGSSLKGAGIGAGIGGTIGSFFGPGPGTAIGLAAGGGIGGIVGAIQGQESLDEQVKAQKSNVEATQELSQNMKSLGEQINGLNKNLGNLVGDRDLRATIGDARITAAFARNIA